MKKNDLFNTSDFNEIIILYASDLKINKTETVGARMYFYFEDGTKCRKILSDYLNDTLIMSVKKILESVRVIKSIIFKRNI